MQGPRKYEADSVRRGAILMSDVIVSLHIVHGIKFFDGDVHQRFYVYDILAEHSDRPAHELALMIADGIAQGKHHNYVFHDLCQQEIARRI